ncbi:17895_t:CDS:2 [Entrophospora sp. SA101]|nr:17895_t:CDS:2 [Entrophospora sp. SA101]
MIYITTFIYSYTYFNTSLPNEYTLTSGGISALDDDNLIVNRNYVLKIIA